jgi:translation initiation factor IF-2
MSDGNDNEAPAGRKPLTLSRNVGAGTVRQSFSHGRTNQVVVEVKKKRIIGPGDAPAAGTPGVAPKPAFTPNVRPAAPAPAAKAAPASGSAPAVAPVRMTKTLGLSEGEMKARTAALERAREQENTRREQQRAEAEARQRRDDLDRRRLEEERKYAEEETIRKQLEEEARMTAEARASSSISCRRQEQPRSSGTSP